MWNEPAEYMLHVEGLIQPIPNLRLFRKKIYWESLDQEYHLIADSVWEMMSRSLDLAGFWQWSCFVSELAIVMYARWG